MSERLQQIRCSFSRQEGRLLLEINSSERTAYRLWLTRRFVKLFWGKLLGRLERLDVAVAAQPAPSEKRAVMAFRKQEAVEASDFSRPYEGEDLTYPLGDTPLLPTKFNVGGLQDGATRITFTAGEDTNVAINLSREQVYSLCHLISSTVGANGWDLDMTIDESPGAMAPDDAPKVVH